MLQPPDHRGRRPPLPCVRTTTPLACCRQRPMLAHPPGATWTHARKVTHTPAGHLPGRPSQLRPGDEDCYLLFNDHSPACGQRSLRRRPSSACSRPQLRVIDGDDALTPTGGLPNGPNRGRPWLPRAFVQLPWLCGPWLSPPLATPRMRPADTEHHWPVHRPVPSLPDAPSWPTSHTTLRNGQATNPGVGTAQGLLISFG